MKKKIMLEAVIYLNSLGQWAIGGHKECQGSQEDILENWALLGDIHTDLPARKILLTICVDAVPKSKSQGCCNGCGQDLPGITVDEIELEEYEVEL